MSDAKAILKQYWGYQSFRDPQSQVIDSVLNTQDTFTLMPTGGGKSLCFQVPGLMMEGICLIVTPLIALMQDQVRQLTAMGVQALAIHTGMNARDIDIKLDNCVYGNVKFLYVSPERLQTDLFKARVSKMQVNLLVVDEAHCISEWGYDFRPAYLHIAEIRKLIPQVPILALTATATPQVKLDIIDKLEMNDPQVFQVSFARENLSYQVDQTEDKFARLTRALDDHPGSALVYVNTRKNARTVAQNLQKAGYDASFYHGGLPNQDRTAIQNHWLEERSRIMVATNAFGMGINKPNVRLVVHYDLPDHLEAYYQEAGRAGRDGKSALAVMLYQMGDIDALKERKHQEYPQVGYLKEVYQHLANHYQIAVGSASAEEQDFELDEFAGKIQEKPLKVYHALKKLQTLGFIELTEDFFQPSHFQFTADHQQVYEFQIAQAYYDPIIKALLRLYGGELFTREVNISENKLAKVLAVPESEIKRLLMALQDRQIAIFQPRKDQPQVCFIGVRQDAQRLNIDQQNYHERRKLELDKLTAVQRYVQNRRGCRSLMLLDYFGERSSKKCGQCDNCLGAPLEPASEFRQQYQDIQQQLTIEPLTAKGLVDRLRQHPQQSLGKTIQIMLENGDIIYDRLGRLVLPSGLV